MPLTPFLGCELPAIALGTNCFMSAGSMLSSTSVSLDACPPGTQEFRWLGLAALSSGAVTAAWLHSGTLAQSMPWEHLEAGRRLAASPRLQVAFTGVDGRDFASDRDEILLELRRREGTRWISPIQALATWARYFFPAPKLWIFQANRHTDSALVEIEGERLQITVVPYADSVLEFFSLVAARCGWRHAEERLQWQSLLGFSSLDRLPAWEGERLQLPVAQALQAIAPLPSAERAACAQRALETSLLSVFHAAHRADSDRQFCLMGDFAHNALLVRALERAGIPVRVPFAAGQHGLALGAALAAAHPALPAPAASPSPFLGPAWSDEQIKETIDNCRLRAAWLNDAALLDLAVEELNAHHILGWFQGPAELGPRALGARSILASPAMPYLRENLNLYVKNRELFRPFALSMPEEAAAAWADAGPNCRYLASLARPLPRLAERAPELILPNGELRLQLVRERENPLFHRLLCRIGVVTGLPALVQTSFNAPGEPVVSTPRQALRTFYSHGLDTLLLGHWLLRK